MKGPTKMNGDTGAGAATTVKTARNRVGMSFMVNPDTEAIVEVTREKYPDATIAFRDCFYKVERHNSLEWSMEDVGDRLGRPYDTDLFLVNMSSYYGRIVVSDGKVLLTSEMLPTRFRE
jgi:propane monooxygenase coupling protein